MITRRKRVGSLGHSLANLAVGSGTTSGRPVFVAGNGRSGTSWIGETLGRAEGVLYYREPCHPKRNGLSPADANRIWCRYLVPGDRDPFFEYTLGRAFRGHFWRGAGHPFSVYRDRIGQRPRILVKEVASFLSAEWVAECWDPNVLLILRHPGAYAASVRALGQGPEEVARLELLLGNERLRTGSLKHLLGRLESLVDPLDAAVASWGIRTATVLKACERHPEWAVVHYEDVARNPVEEFSALYTRFELPWSESVANRVRAKASSEGSGPFSTSRVSRSRIDAWKRDLTGDEVMRVRRIVELFELPVYFSAEDWTGPYGSPS